MHTLHMINVDQEIFTVKILGQLLWWQKLNAQENFMRTFNFCHLATWRKLNTQTFLTRKKSCARISRSTVCPTSSVYLLIV